MDYHKIRQMLSHGGEIWVCTEDGNMFVHREDKSQAMDPRFGWPKAWMPVKGPQLLAPKPAPKPEDN